MSNKTPIAQITIYPFRSDNRKQVCSYHSFFDQEVIMSIDHEKITFTLPTIDYTGKTFKFSTNPKNGQLKQTSLAIDVPVGTYLADEDESNEDQMVFYFKNTQ